MAQGGEENVFYAFFTCKCRGIKFYDLVNVELEFWHSVSFQREPETRTTATLSWCTRSLKTREN